MERVLRPRAALLTAVVLSAILLVGCALGWLLLPAEVRVLFTPIQVATLALFVVVMIALMLAVGLSVVVITDAGLVIRNGLRTHVVGWEHVTGVRFGPDDSWAFVDLEGEPDSRPLLAVQRADGDRAEAAVGELRAALAAHREDR